MELALLFYTKLDRIHNSVAEASLKHLEKTIDSILLDNLFTKTGKVVNPRIIYIAVVLVKEIRKLQEEGYAIKL